MASAAFDCAGTPAEFRGVDRNGWAYVLSAVNVALFPVFVVVCLAVFRYQQRNYLFLRKRSWTLVWLTCVNSLSTWACTVVFDVVGSAQYPCVLFGFLMYVAVPTIATPILVKLMWFSGAYSRIIFDQVRNEQLREGSRGDFFIPTLTTSRVSRQTIFCYLKKIFMPWRDLPPTQEFLSLQFESSSWFVVFWVFATSSVFVLAFFVHLALDPRWYNNCAGCDMLFYDVLFFLIAVPVGCIVIFLIARPSFMLADPLEIVREVLFTIALGGSACFVGMILFLVDPGGVYRVHGDFNWRIVVLWGVGVMVYWGTIHQVWKARRLRVYMLLAFDEDATTSVDAAMNVKDKFQAVLANQELRRELVDHLNSELCPEIMLFLDQVDSWKQAHNEPGSAERARLIFETYIAPNAPYEVNIASATRERLAQVFAPIRPVVPMRRPISFRNPAPRHHTSSGNNSEIHEDGSAALETGLVERSVFDEAYAEVKDSLMRDSFLRFLAAAKKRHRSVGLLVPSPTLPTSVASNTSMRM